ncbi:NAD-dependent epimerase/dehydratase family protein [Muricoccus radiodurans]|uniref:NAD-dependent epimerase/dehydratase family protein n=1 Tax=Muricoccus radiodurans TaxID=2231721 RepID=UPI003CEF3D50
MAGILVTGAGGFLGGHVVRHLRTSGMEVLPATRDGRGGSRRLDLRDPAGMGAALSGVESVVHCAVSDRAVTVDGTQALLDAATAAGVRRLVHFSSIAVYGEAAGAVTEETPLLSPDTPGYAGWKVAAEAACLAARGIEVVRLRPTIVYGPGSPLWVGKMAERIRAGVWGTFGEAGEGTCNLVHVDDVAGAVLAALSAPAAGQVFNVNGPEAVSWNAWFVRLAEAIGAPPLPAIPPGRLRARSLLSLPFKAAARLRPGLAPRWVLGAPAGSEMALFARRATYPTGAARDGLGWVPRVGLEEGLRDTTAWLLARGTAGG